MSPLNGKQESKITVKVIFITEGLKLTTSDLLNCASFNTCLAITQCIRILLSKHKSESSSQKDTFIPVKSCISK